MVAGTSFGAIVGTLHCLGYSASDLENVARNTKLRKLFDIGILKSGLFKGKKVEEFLRELFEDKKFSDLEKPLFLPAVDIISGEEIMFNKGDLTKAVRASISLPGIFYPVENNKRILVDGGVLDVLPIDVLKKNGADIVIAVNLATKRKKEFVYEEAKKETKDVKIPNIFSIISHSIALSNRETSRLNLENNQADILLCPDVKDIKYNEFKRYEEIIKKGEDEANKQLGNILALTKKKNIIQKLIDVVKDV